MPEKLKVFSILTRIYISVYNIRIKHVKPRPKIYSWYTIDNAECYESTVNYTINMGNDHRNPITLHTVSLTSLNRNIIPWRKQYSNENAGKETVTIANGLKGTVSWTSSTLRVSNFPILSQISIQNHSTSFVTVAGILVAHKPDSFDFLVDGEIQVNSFVDCRFWFHRLFHGKSYLTEKWRRTRHVYLFLFWKYMKLNLTNAFIIMSTILINSNHLVEFHWISLSKLAHW